MTMLLIGYLLGRGQKLRMITWSYLMISLALCGFFWIDVDTTQAARNANYCGDGILYEEGGEQCDDGNYDAGDGCDANCQFEFSTSSVDTGDTAEEDSEVEETEQAAAASDTGDSSEQADQSEQTEHGSALDPDDLIDADIDLVPFLAELSDPDYYLTKTSSAAFYGNNPHFYRALHDAFVDQSPAIQHTLLDRLIDNLEEIHATFLRKEYNLDKNGLIDILAGLLEQGTIVDGPTDSVDMTYSDGLIVFRTPRSDQLLTKHPIVFGIDTDKTIKHLDWNFDDGFTYGCDRGQCSDIPVTYDEPGIYTVTVTVVYQTNTITKAETTIEVLPRQDHVSSPYKSRGETTHRRSRVLRPDPKPRMWLGEPISAVDLDEVTIDIYPVNADQPTAGEWTIYRVETTQPIAHMDFQFGDGRTYGCERDRCAAVPVQYDLPGDYPVKYTIELANGDLIFQELEVTVY